MQLVDPEILVECSGLYPGITAAGALLGFVLWLCGWRWHRFWLAAVLTTTAGIIGLVGGGGNDHALAVALLLAICAGVLALELGRLLVFAGSGLVVCLLIRSALPNAQELTVVFLLAGLAGILLYRIWVIVLTSFVGTMLFWYSVLGLAAHTLKYDVTGWIADKDVYLNGLILGATALGMLAQTWLERRRAKKGGDSNKESSDDSGLSLLKWPNWLKFRGGKAA